MHILCKYFTFSHVRGIEQKKRQQQANKQTSRQKTTCVCVCAIIAYYQHTGRVENKHVSR